MTFSFSSGDLSEFFVGVFVLFVQREGDAEVRRRSDAAGGAGLVSSVERT